MQLIGRSVIALAASICIGSPLFADLAPNPYFAVIERNPFGLREPPPPPPVTPPPPAAPLPKVVLTGIITSLFGPTPKVLLEVTEQEPGRAANVKRPILRQGEKDGMIEVLLIDVANNQVKIRNGTVETNITFEVAKASGGPAGGLPSIPGLVPPGLPTSPAAPGAPQTSAATPTIISPGGVNTAGRANTGVSTYNGAGTAAYPAATAPGNYANNAATYANAGVNTASYNNPNSGIATYGSGNIPPRETRTDTAAQEQQRKIESYNAVQNMKTVADQINQNRNFPPLPVPPSRFH